jgi:putative transposase
VTHRGHPRQQIFFPESDYLLYSDLLSKYCEGAQLRIWAFCLMPNHIHLILLPEYSRGMAHALGRTHADFARRYNLKKRACGHVWQARYFSAPLQPAHLWRAMAYVERNPVRAHLVEHAEQYAWSSTRLRRPGAENGCRIDLSGWRAEYDWQCWKEALETSMDEEAFGRRLHEASRRGRPLGEEQFTTELENRCGRRIRAGPVGPPKKSDEEEKDQLALGFGV